MTDADLSSTSFDGPLPAAPQTSPAVPAEQRYAFAFTGHAGEYFRIWIVSLCLSVLTLGVYSAWGKVRKTRYLHAHTRVAGDGIDYRASPLAILRGRVIALVLFGGFALAGNVLPLAQLALVLLLVVLSPWIVVAAARFRARNSTYRNIAFAFDGRYGEAAWVFVGAALLVGVTLGLAYPWYRARRARFVVARHRFGATQFATTLKTGGFFRVYVLAALMIAGVIGMAIGIGALGLGRRSPGPPVGFFLTMAATYVAYIAVYGYVRARTLNLVANSTSIGPMRLASTLRARHLAWLYVSNVGAILASVGLATPWATVRVARYRAECLALHATTPIDAFAAGPSKSAAATGSEVSDLFDVDVSL